MIWSFTAGKERGDKFQWKQLHVVPWSENNFMESGEENRENTN